MSDLEAGDICERVAWYQRAMRAEAKLADVEARFEYLERVAREVAQVTIDPRDIVLASPVRRLRLTLGMEDEDE